MRILSRRDRSEPGQVLVMVAFSLTALLGFSALVVDIGMMWSEQQRHRSVADSAVLAGAQEMQIYGLRGINSASREEARYAALANVRDRIGATGMPTCATGGAPTSDLDGDGKLGYAADVRNCPMPGTDWTASVVTPSPICATCELDRSIMVEVKSEVPTIIAGLFGEDGWTIRKTSVATITYSADFAVLTLRPPSSDATSPKDVFVNGTGTNLHVSVGDIGTNTNMVLSQGTVTIDEGYRVHHWDAVPAWTQPPPAKKLINLIEDPNHPYPTRAGAPTYSSLAAARMTDAACNTERAKVPAQYKWGGVSVKDLPDITKIYCLKPGIYTFMPEAKTATNMLLFTPGMYFLDKGLRVRTVAIGGYEPGKPGVAMVFNETVEGRLDSNNAEAFAVNAGGRFGGGTGAEATHAIGFDGVPLGAGGELNLVLTLLVTKDPNCKVVQPYPTSCNDTGNKALSMAGGGSLYLAGVQYAPTDNVVISGGSSGVGHAGRIVSWTVTYAGGTRVTQAYPGEREGNGILRLDAACTGAGSKSMSNALCNP